LKSEGKERTRESVRIPYVPAISSECGESGKDIECRLKRCLS
jgi:hypothetical protein